MFATSVPVSSVEDTLDEAYRSWSEATCISSPTASPQDSELPLDPIASPVEEGEIAAALAALEGRPLPSEVVSRQDPVGIAEAGPTVVAEPPVAYGLMRMGIYRDIELPIILGDWQRISDLIPAIAAMRPQLTTLGPMTYLDIGPVTRSQAATYCQAAWSVAVHCQPARAMPDIDIRDFLTYAIPALPVPAVTRCTTPNDAASCRSTWRKAHPAIALRQGMMADFPPPIPVPTPRPSRTIALTQSR